MTNVKSEALVTYVSDMHAMIAHGLEAIQRQVENLKNVSHADAMPALNKAKLILTEHKALLEVRLKQLGGSSTAPLKEAAAVVAGLAAGLINAMRTTETVKSLRDDATFFSGVNVAYLLLFTTASGLGDSETAGLAQHGYEDSARLVMHFDHILPKITVEELRETKPDIMDVGTTVTAMVAKSWDRANELHV